MTAYISDNLPQKNKNKSKTTKVLSVCGGGGGEVLATKNTVTRSMICVVGAGTHREVLGEAA